MNSDERPFFLAALALASITPICRALLRIADCGLRIVWANIFRERNPQSAIRNGDRDLAPRHRCQDYVSLLPDSQVAHAGSPS